MQKRYGALIVVCVLIAFVFFRSDSNEFPVEVFSYQDKVDGYEVAIEYPQFPELPRSFNKKIRSTVENEQRVFLSEIEKNKKAQARQESKSVYWFYVKWSPDQVNDEITSIILRTYFYTGGAHGGEKIFTFTFDKKKKKEIMFDDLFAGVSNSVERVSQYVMNDLLSQLERQSGGENNSQMIREGAGPKKENFFRFTISNNGIITFYFEEYQVAAYAYGEQKVRMPLSYLK